MNVICQLKGGKGAKEQVDKKKKAEENKKRSEVNTGEFNGQVNLRKSSAYLKLQPLLLHKNCGRAVKNQWASGIVKEPKASREEESVGGKNQ